MTPNRQAVTATHGAQLGTWLRKWWRPLVVLGLIGMVGVAGPWLMPVDPFFQDLTNRLSPPTWQHPLGTDDLGRDLLSRLLIGSRTSLVAALIAVSISVISGLILGLAGGYFGGPLDKMVTLIHDTLLSFPPLLLAVGIVAVIGPGVVNAMIAIGIVLTPRFGRLVRSVTIRIREEQYIEAARVVGVGRLRMLRLYVTPNLMGPMLVQLMLAASVAIISEASLSFLGLGTQPPQTSWGLLLARGYTHVHTSTMGLVAPIIAIVATVLGLNFAGEYVRNVVEGNKRAESVL